MSQQSSTPSDLLTSSQFLFLLQEGYEAGEFENIPASPSAAAESLQQNAAHLDLDFFYRPEYSQQFPDDVSVSDSQLLSAAEEIELGEDVLRQLDLPFESRGQYKKPTHHFSIFICLLTGESVT